jgi:transcriptional regulator with XRE-family HTH domain
LARLGLKLFYLRTREKRVSQQDAADAIGIRQATLSQVERGRSSPNCALLLELCRFYDVTPTFLLDDERGPEPLPSERWSVRNALVTVGMWVEAPRSAVVAASEDKVLCPLLPGESFYDTEAAELRRAAASQRAVERDLKSLSQRRRRDEARTIRALDQELQLHPRQRGR